MGRALAVGIVPVVGHESIVVRRQQAVLLVPAQLALTGLLVTLAILFLTRGVNVYEVAVGIILVGMAVLDIRILTGCLLGAVVHVTDGLELELLSRIRSVGV